MGRPQKPYKTSWNQTIDGLYKMPDGRWKIVASGERFSEPDEYKAVSKFKARGGNENETIFVPIAVGTPAQIAEFENANSLPPGTTLYKASDDDDKDKDSEDQIGQLVHKRAAYEMVRNEIIESPDLAVASATK